MTFHSFSYIKKINKNFLVSNQNKILLNQNLDLYDFYIIKHKEPANVAKIKACIALVNSPKIIKGIGTTKGTRETITDTTNSSASIFPNNRKLSERGFAKSSKTLIGNKIGVGSIYLAK